MTRQERIVEIEERLNKHSKTFHYILRDPDSASDDFDKALEIIRELEEENKKLKEQFEILGRSSKDFYNNFKRG